MHDPGAMRDRERTGHLARDLEGFLWWYGVLVHSFTQGGAFDKLRRDVVGRTNLSDLVNGHDVRVIQSRSDARLALQAGQFGLVRRERGWKKLERDLATESFVAGAVDDAHPAHASDCVHSIPAEVLADQTLRIGGEKGRRHRTGRRSDKVSGIIVRAQEQFHAASQRLIAVATALENRGALARGLLHRAVEDFGATLPALRVHPSLLR